MKRFFITFISSILLLSTSIAAHATSVGIENNTSNYLVLTATSAGGSTSGYCSENGSKKDCYGVLNPQSTQWVNLDSSDSYIVLSYNACTSASGGNCSGYQANMSVTVNSSGASLKMNDGTGYSIGGQVNGIYLINGGSGGGGTTGVPLTVIFDNQSPAVAHVDYSSTDFSINPSPDDNGNLAYLSKTTFTANASSSLSIQVAQYGVGSLLPTTPTCYYDFNLSSGSWVPQADSKTTTDYCSVKSTGTNSYTITLTWPAVAPVNYSALLQNSIFTVNSFLTSKGNSFMVPNQLPMSSAQLNNFVSAIQASPSGNGWALQFAYDSIRLPLWIGAYYEQNGGGTNNTNIQWMSSYLTGLMQFLSTNTCTNSDGNTSVNTNGYWAYTVPNVSTDGQAVAPAGCGSTPALEGPLAVAAQAANSTDLMNKLITTLSSYNLANNTFSTFSTANGPQLSQSNYTSSSSPYFNATLDLISEALLIGKGSFNISAANSTGAVTDYLNYQQFLTNYQAWLADGFVTSFNAPDPANGKTTQPALRVLYSTYNAINYKNNNPANTPGNSPTVSEGMGYGLLLAYAANDQATFDKFVWFVYSEAFYKGCARSTADQTACSIKSQYLMPWMVDESGNPFNYAVGGGYMTNGSATDADIQIVWALNLAQQRVTAGTWTASKFDNMTYGQLATAMAGEINRYEINMSTQYMGAVLPNGDGVMFTPGSQWGTPVPPTAGGTGISGTELIYPGYITPQAFDILNSIQPQN